MENKEQTILKIRKKVQDYKKYIAEYGFNQERDIFINEDISKILENLDELEKEINDEK
tara:strand:+ start:5224 stop:5397 length:174 start_codon:yes stop_codon:yes gene_type:complete